MENSEQTEKIGIEAEFDKSNLGDRRRTKRLLRIASSFSSHAGESIPQALGTERDREATYRFLNNSNVTMPEILEGHFLCTAQRARHYEELLILHDTTELAFSTPREGLGPLRDSSSHYGFFAHVSLCVGLDKRTDPLGLLSVEAWTRTATNKKMRKAAGVNEMQRWWNCAHKAQDRLGPEAPTSIHVMDREGDAFELFSRLHRADARFVIRACHDRNLAEDSVKLFEAGRNASIHAIRTVSLSPRKKASTPKAAKIYPARRQRVAELSIRATKVTLKRSRNLRGRDDLCKESTLNLVYVQETNCSEGLVPVEWHLLTTEPIDTPEDVLKIVDIYRARWLIEELFKALKSGCGYQRLQLANYVTLQRALGIFLPVAWNLLRLRYLSGISSDAPASMMLD